MTFATPHPAELIVGVGEFALAAPPIQVVTTHALGSCVAVFAWDPVTQRSGCLHFMRPIADPGTRFPSKFADTGLRRLLEELGQARSLRLVACGGAIITSGGARFRLGPKNVAALTQLTAELGLVLAAHDLGGCQARTASLDLRTGRVTVVTGSRALVL